MDRLLLIALLLISACDVGLLAPGPDVHGTNVRPMSPVPAVYSEWYAETERCLGMAGDFSAIRWFVADEILADGEPVTGWLKDGGEVVMLETYADLEWAVRHEMSHHITGWDNSAHQEGGRIPCQSS